MSQLAIKLLASFGLLVIGAVIMFGLVHYSETAVVMGLTLAVSQTAVIIICIRALHLLWPNPPKPPEENAPKNLKGA